MAIIDGSKKRKENPVEEQKKIEYKEKDGKTYRVVLEENDENSYINQFKKSFEAGLKGDTVVLSTGFSKLDNFMSIRKKVYYVIGASTGVGKTSWTDNAFVFKPIEWFMEQVNPKIDLKILYWSLERSMDEKIARWIARKIFMTYQIIITPDEILSRKVNSSLSPDKAALVRKYIDDIQYIMDNILTVHAGSTNPNDINIKLKEFAEKRGEKEIVIIRKNNGYEYLKSIYVPNNPDEFVIVIVDPINRIRTEKNTKEGRTLTKKEAIDKVSEHLLSARDDFGYCVVSTAQFNRGMSDTNRLGSERGITPMLSDFKETSNLSEDGEVIITIFDPTALKVNDLFGYDLNKLREGREDKMPGNKKYRSLYILKNSYGPNDVGIGLAFQPQVGEFKQMPDLIKMNDAIYKSILDDSYFLI